MSAKFNKARERAIRWLRWLGGGALVASLLLYPSLSHAAWDSTKPAQTQTVSQGFTSTLDNFAAIEAGTAIIPETAAAQFAIEGEDTDAYEFIIDPPTFTADRKWIPPDDSIASADLFIGSAADTIVYATPSGDATMTNAGVFTIKVGGESVSLSLPTSKLLQTLVHDGANWVNHDRFSYHTWNLPTHHGVPQASTGALRALDILGQHFLYAGSSPTALADGGLGFFSDGTNELRFALCDGTGATASDVSFPISTSGNTVWMRIKFAYQGAADNAAIGIGNDSGALPNTDVIPTDGVWIRVGSTNMTFSHADDDTRIDTAWIATDTSTHTIEFKLTESQIEWWADDVAQTPIDGTANDIPIDETLSPFIMVDSTTATKGFHVYEWEIQWGY